MKIFETIERGEFLNFSNPDKSIDTMLSRLYFFENIVLKRYKHINAFYGNMSDKAYRKFFYEADFFWNNYMAPEIYLKLCGVKELDGKYFETELDEADDFIIFMSKIDDSQNLTKSLNDKTATAEMLRKFIDLIVEKPRRLLVDQESKLKHIAQRGWQSLFDQNMDDLRNWAYLSEKQIPRHLADEAVDLISMRVRAEKYFKNFDNSNLSAVIDNNCDNLLVLNGKPSFIDIMPPKENWKVADEYWMMSRTIVDTYVLGNKELGEIAHKHYERYRQDIPEAVTLAYELRSALVQATYNYILGRLESAEKYMDFIIDRMRKLR